MLLRTVGTKTWRRSAGCSALDAVSHSRILIGRHRSLQLKLLSGVTAMMILFETLQGRSKALIRASTGCRRHELGLLGTSWAGIPCRREEHKVCLRSLIVCSCLLRETRCWGLGKPCLLVVRGERLETVGWNGCCEARTETT